MAAAGRRWQRCSSCGCRLMSASGQRPCCPSHGRGHHLPGRSTSIPAVWRTAWLRESACWAVAVERWAGEGQQDARGCFCLLPCRIQRPPSLQCRHSVRPRPARPMLTAPPCTRRRPACRMSTSRGSGNDFAARPAQQPQHLHGAPIIMRVQHPAQGRRTEVSSMLQHVQ